MQTFKIILSLFLFIPIFEVHKPSADLQYYYVYFTDKGLQEPLFCPEEYLSAAAIERRIRQGLDLVDWYDLPLDKSYVQESRKRVSHIRHELRWINAISVAANPYQIEQLGQLPFVKSIEAFQMEPQLSQRGVGDASDANQRLDTLLSLSRSILELDLLADSGLSGKGVNIAIFDAGFKHADCHPALEHVRKRNGFLAQYDFYDQDSSVFEHSFHGMQVMSCIAGMYQNRLLGSAPDVNFLLARIEHERKEPLIEEDNWLAAAEWAERMGADIINSSVNYTHKRYHPIQMDGKTAPVCEAAKIATKKGILVVCSMGNDGDNSWKIMGAPADVPEVLSVGGSYPMMPMKMPFASTGPNSLGQLKPDISAPAFVLTALKKDLYGENAGTSFASPLVAGIAACLLERQPEKKPDALAQMIRESGHFYPYFDYDLGHGIPQISHFFRDSLPVIPPRFEVEMQIDTVWVHFDTTYMVKDSFLYPNGRILNYHMETFVGSLRAYQSIRLPNKTKSYYFRRNLSSRGRLRIWMDGYLYEKQLF